MPTASGASSGNPLRILDSKNPEMQELIAGAPLLTDHLDAGVARSTSPRCAPCSTRIGIDYTVNPRLVRGLDYYSRTVFEWITDALRRAGCRMLRRPLRRPDRAAGRRGDAGDRLRHGHGARGRAAGGRRAARPRRGAPDVYVVVSGAAGRRAGAASSSSGCATSCRGAGSS